MGLRPKSKYFSDKFVNAIIIDASDRAHFMPIRNTIGDYFIATVDDQKYVFSMKGKKFTYHDWGVESIEFYVYNTAHYKPVDPDAMSELDLIMKQNDLPRLNMMLLSILKILGQKEKTKFEPHKVQDLKKWVEEQKKKPENAKDNDFIEQAENIIQYLDHLSIDKIVTPIKKITEFLDDDLIATDAKYPGAIIDSVLQAELETKKINNTPIKAKTAWIKYIAIFSVIGLVGAVVYIAYEGGAFDAVVKPLKGIGDIDFNLASPSQSSSAIVNRYPTPEAMKCAIERGEITISSVPADLKPLVNSAKCVPGVPQAGGTP